MRATVVLFMVLVVVAWFVVAGMTAVRSTAAARRRTQHRAVADVPEGLQPAIVEPRALRMPFALTARGEVVDVAQSFVGTFRSGQLALMDVLVRIDGGPPQPFTLVTVELTWIWPWARLRDRTITVPEVADHDVEAEHLPDDRRWVVEGADPELAAQLFSPEVIAWVERLDVPLLVECLPRNLLVAAPGRLPAPELPGFVDLATGILDHVSPVVREQVQAPDPADSPDPYGRTDDILLRDVTGQSAATDANAPEDLSAGQERP